jgi:Domain of unknown function (DUF4387)
VLSPESIAKIYRVELEEVRLFNIEQILTIKFSRPRKVFSGDVGDTDVYRGQFHGPLVRVLIDEVS